MDLMDIRFYGTWYGKRFYRVVRDGTPIFTGTKGECSRFIRLHLEKQQKELRDFSVPRRRKVLVPRYRIATRRVGAC
jgi:hypothetical protein